jgi:hypothetical protein
MQVFSPADEAFLLPPAGRQMGSPDEDEDAETPVPRMRLPSGSPAMVHQNALFNGITPEKELLRQPGSMADNLQVGGQHVLSNQRSLNHAAASAVPSELAVGITA